jgi:hypothetical protein
MLAKVWLDDIRVAPNGYTHVKSVNSAKRLISHCIEQGYEIELDLDHDLGDYAYDGGDGIKLVLWLAETGRHYPIRLHTQNVVGRENMQAIIDRYWNR